MVGEALGRTGGAKVVDDDTEAFLDLTLAAPVDGIIDRHHIQKREDVKEAGWFPALIGSPMNATTLRNEVAKRAGVVTTPGENPVMEGLTRLHVPPILALPRIDD